MASQLTRTRCERYGLILNHCEWPILSLLASLWLTSSHSRQFLCKQTPIPKGQENCLPQEAIFTKKQEFCHKNYSNPLLVAYSILSWLCFGSKAIHHAHIFSLKTTSMQTNSQTQRARKLSATRGHIYQNNKNVATKIIVTHC